MQSKKDRVIALDYFRGICILLILLSHSVVFSGPFSYFSLRSSPWVSAAEFFFLLSGITLGVVRGGKIESDLWGIAKKCWRRARDLYLIHLVIVLASLGLGGFLVTNHLLNNIHGQLPIDHGPRLLIDILSLSYAYGSYFLMFYAIYMLLAPIALLTLRTRLWCAVPLLSTLLFVLAAHYPFQDISFAPYTAFFIWQFYFMLGLTLARFRVPIISRIYGLPKRTVNIVSAAIIGSAVTVFVLSVLVTYSSHIFPLVNRLTVDGWLPVKLRSAYIHLINHSQGFYLWLDNARTGVLRPLATLLFMAAAYLIYQKHKETILLYSGRFVNNFGRNTLWIYVAQAFVIPIMAAVPVRHSLAMEIIMTSILLGLMWLVTKRSGITNAVRSYSRRPYFQTVKKKIPTVFTEPRFIFPRQMSD